MRFTPRRGLQLPENVEPNVEPVDVEVINANFEVLDNVAGATLATSTTRPDSPAAGDLIYETDTGASYFFNGTSWRSVAGGAKVIETDLLEFLNSGAYAGYSEGDIIYSTVYKAPFRIDRENNKLIPLAVVRQAANEYNSWPVATTLTNNNVTRMGTWKIDPRPWDRFFQASVNMTLSNLAAGNAARLTTYFIANDEVAAMDTSTGAGASGLYLTYHNTGTATQEFAQTSGSWTHGLMARNTGYFKVLGERTKGTGTITFNNGPGGVLNMDLISANMYTQAITSDTSYPK